MNNNKRYCVDSNNRMLCGSKKPMQIDIKYVVLFIIPIVTNLNVSFIYRSFYFGHYSNNDFLLDFLLTAI